MKKSLVLIFLLVLLIPISSAKEVVIKDLFIVEDKAETSSEEIGGSVTTYFYAGSKLLASKENDELTYHYQDRLGSDTESKSLPFGQEIVKGDRFSFTGKELDNELYYFGARYYDSNLGRFTSKDPVPSEPVYQYVGNNPLMFVDTSGRSIEFLDYIDVGSYTRYESDRTHEITNLFEGGEEGNPMYFDMSVNLNTRLGVEAFMLNENNELKVFPDYTHDESKFSDRDNEWFNFISGMIDSDKRTVVVLDHYFLPGTFKSGENYIIHMSPFGGVDIPEGNDASMVPSGFVEAFSHELGHVSCDNCPEETIPIYYGNLAAPADQQRIYYGHAFYDDSIMLFPIDSPEGKPDMIYKPGLYEQNQKNIREFFLRINSDPLIVERLSN